VVALLGYAVKQIAFPSPEAAVQRYFDALQARDLGGAAEQLADHFSPTEGNWSVIWRVLSNPHYQPPTGLRMGGWQSAPTAEGERVVAVQYDLAGTTYSSLLKLRKLGGLWAITNGTGTLEVNIPGAVVNGQQAGKGMRLLPGVYQVESNPVAPLLTAAAVEVAVTPDRVGTARLTPTLASEAANNVKGHLAMLLKVCETTMGVEKLDCPFKGIDVAGLHQVTWTLVSMPELTVEQTGPDSVRVLGVGAGSVRLNALDAAGGGIDRVDSFSINGKCVEDDGSVRCTFTG